MNRFSQTINNEAKEQKGRLLEMFLGNLGATLLGNILIDEGEIRTG